MALIILIILAVVVFWDARLLRQRNEALYQEILRCDETRWAFLCFLLSLAALPIYLLRRRRFKIALRQLPSSIDAETFAVPAGAPTLEPAPAVIASDALGILLVWILGMMVFEVLMIISEFFYLRPEKDIGDLLLSAVFSLAWMIFLIQQTTSGYREKFIDFVGLRRQGKPLWKIVVLPALLGIGLAFFSVVILLSRPDQPATPLSEILESTSYSMFFIFLAIALVLAPLGEEIIFRGYFYRVLSVFKGQGWAIVIVAVLFGLFHVEQFCGDWLAIAVVALLGFVLTFLRAWTQSTIASAVLHYAYNGSVTILPIIFLAFSNTAFLEYQLKYSQLDFTAKERLLKQSIQEDPGFHQAYNDLAWLYTGEETHLDEALRLVDKALAYQPERDAYLDTKAEVLYRLGRFAQAAAIAEELLKRNPEKEYFQKQLQKFREGILIEQSI